MPKDNEPLLDNIETMYHSRKIPKHLKNRAFGLQNANFLYNSDDIKAMHFYKVLAYDTAIALYDFGDIVTLRNRAEKMLQCGTRIGYDDSGKIVFANFCRQRLCPLCQRRRSLKVYANFQKLLAELSDYKFLHMVLTVPNCDVDELSDLLDTMQKLSSRLFRLPALKRAFKGIARCTEVSYNGKTNTFHPHFHCLVCVSKSYATSRDYIRHKDLRLWWSALWQLRDVERIERIKDDEIYAMADELNAKDLLQLFITVADENALPEIAKYAVKPLELDLSRQERAYVLEKLFAGLCGRRLIQTYGIIKETFARLRIDPEAVDEENNAENVCDIFNWEWSEALHSYAYLIGEC